MKISILSNNVTSKTSAKGKPYQNVEVVYRNIDTGKVENKNITQYSDIFKTVCEAQPGQTFDVTSQKPEGSQFWEWVEFKRDMESKIPVGAPTSFPSARTGQWETPEERAAKQVYIVRQSSLSTAVTALSVGAKTPPTPEQLIQFADKLTEWVFADKSEDLFSQPNDLEVN